MPMCNPTQIDGFYVQSADEFMIRIGNIDVFFIELESAVFQSFYFSIPKTGHSFIHSFIHLYIYTFIHSYIHTFIHSYIYAVVLSTVVVPCIIDFCYTFNDHVHLLIITCLLILLQGLPKYGAELSDDEGDVALGDIVNKQDLSKDSIAYDSDLDKSCSDNDEN